MVLLYFLYLQLLKIFKMAKTFGIPLKYTSKIDLAKKFLDIYLVVKPPKENIVERAKEALAYFLAYGYSKESEKKLQSGLSQKIQNSYVRVIMNKLKVNGYIVRDQKNHQKRLSDEMLNCQKEIFKNNKRTFTIGFIQNYG